MDDKRLKDLMEYLATSNFVEFEYEHEGFKLRVVRPSAAGAAGGGTSIEEPGRGTLEASSGDRPPGAQAAPRPTPQSPDSSLGVITSPMVGTFYRAPNPKADPFVEVGDVIKRGQVICIVEAMKLMNEIEADREGEILEIPVTNGQPVEFGETLFRIRPVS